MVAASHKSIIKFETSVICNHNDLFLTFIILCVCMLVFLFGLMVYYDYFFLLFGKYFFWKEHDHSSTSLLMKFQYLLMHFQAREYPFNCTQRHHFMQWNWGRAGESFFEDAHLVFLLFLSVFASL